ncbi:MAG TPA: hypothetical protein VNR87_03840 [Flavisolibacter sp.]|nr:hypothetical protein [Flavisolibacter sp.]
MDTKVKTESFSLEKVFQQFNELHEFLVDRDYNVKMDDILKRWNDYYFGVFSRFDQQLQHYIRHGGVNYQAFLPVSISHHNLHRLFEVLKLEVGHRNLADSRIPERIEDLRTMMVKLFSLFNLTLSANLIKPY